MRLWPRRRDDPFAVGFAEGAARGEGCERDEIEGSIRFFEERRDDCRRRGSESGVLLAEGFIAGLRAKLRDLPDPWICRECGLGYQEGAHTEFGFTGPDAHDYVARGAPGEEPES